MKNIPKGISVIFYIIVTLFLGINAALAYSYSGKHWHAEKAYYRFATSLPSSMRKSTYYGEQKTWDEGSGSNFRFYYDPGSSNSVGYVHIDGTGKTIAQVFLSYDINNPNHIIKAVMEYDHDEQWHTDVSSNPPNTKFDAWNIAAHEFGHWLQLGHSTNMDATMYDFASKGETKKRTLHPDDQNGIRRIYNNH